MATEKPTETKPVKYDTEPCANCGTLAVTTEEVRGDPINPPATLDGTTLSAGDKVKRCNACGALLTKVSSPKKATAKKKRKRSTAKKKRKRSTSKRSSRAKAKSSTSKKSTAKASSSRK